MKLLRVLLVLPLLFTGLVANEAAHEGAEGGHGASAAGHAGPSVPVDFEDESATYMAGPWDLHGHFTVREISKPKVYENGILFTYAGGAKDKVQVSGAFFKWTNEFPLERNRLGVFQGFLAIEIPRGSYPYRFKVNGVWVNDPLQKVREDDGYGTSLSVLKLKRDLFSFTSSPRSLGGDRWLFFLKDKRYRKVSWVGSMNRWDPFVSPMKLSNGYWQIILSPKADEPAYRFMVDGEPMLDPKNTDTAFLKYEDPVSVGPWVPKPKHKAGGGGEGGGH